MLTQALSVATKLGIADLLADGPLTPEEIARRVDASPDGVLRLLRALATIRGMSFWDFLASKPDFEVEFNTAMTTFSNLVKEPVLAAYDFSPYSTIVDVGVVTARCSPPSCSGRPPRGACC